MIITAKFSSVCPTCNAAIVAGAKVEWERGSKAKHAACAGHTEAAATEAATAAAGVGREITVERVGRRSYIRGNTYDVRGMLRSGGCHWDAATKSWWIGSQDDALELARKASTAVGERPSEPSRKQTTRKPYGSGHGYGAPVAGYSAYCTDNEDCGCYDCAS